MTTIQQYDPVTPAKQVTQQDHYTMLSPQPRTVATRWGLMCDVPRYNALKYIARALLKNQFHADLAKAIDWLLWRLMMDNCTDLLRDISAAAMRYAEKRNEILKTEAPPPEAPEDIEL